MGLFASLVRFCRAINIREGTAELAFHFASMREPKILPVHARMSGDRLPAPADLARLGPPLFVFGGTAAGL